MPTKPRPKSVPLRNNGKMIRKTQKKSEVRGTQTNQPDSDRDTMRAPDSYRLALKALRNRAQLTLEECAKAVDLSTTGFQRYENDKNFDIKAIPVRIIRNLIPLMVGKGNPPISEEELWNISEVRDQAPSRAPAATITAWDTTDYSNIPTGRLALKYVVERGVYRTQGLAQPQFGSAPVIPASGWDQDRQFAARVVGPDGMNFKFPSGTLLHCLDVDAIPMASITENLAVIAERQHGDLTEILLARVVEMLGRHQATLRDSDGTEFTGNVLGLIMYQYSPVN